MLGDENPKSEIRNPTRCDRRDARREQIRMKQKWKCKTTSRRRRPDRAHLGAAIGVRPCPGAADPGLPGALEYLDAGIFADPAAPEHGRTPARRALVVLVSKSTPPASLPSTRIFPPPAATWASSESPPSAPARTEVWSIKNTRCFPN